MDRCALFVDAGYVLADGGMAVHGTRRRESVSWDYQGLLQLLASVARERTGLPLLRCYWYEATVEGRRSPDHDTLADLPGVKLRLAKIRPGRREGVESEIHRDLETLARNKAISDAMVVSAEEDLAQVVADVQDHGLRVTLLNIAMNGDSAVSRALRQECDDITEIGSEHLRPYVELISGAEPAQADEAAPLIAMRTSANGHGQPGRMAAPAFGAAYQPVAEDGKAIEPAAADFTAAPPDAVPQPEVAQPEPAPVQHEPLPTRQDPPSVRRDLTAVPRETPAAMHDFGARPETVAEAPVRSDVPGRPDHGALHELYATPLPPAPEDQPLDLPAARSRHNADLYGYNPGATRDPLAGEPGDGMQPVHAASAQIRRLPTRGTSSPAGGPPAGGQPTAAQPVLPAPTGAQPTPMHPAALHPVSSQSPQPAVPRPANLQPMPPGPGYAPVHNGSYSGPQPVVPGGPQAGPSGPAGLAGLPGGVGPQVVPPPAPVAPMGPAGQPNGPVYTPIPGPPGGGGPVGPVGQMGPVGPVGSVGPAGAVAYPQSSVSLAEAVQSAHDEGQEFGSSVARDAPALWLEAVLARKPRMPSDLEARLLQGSGLPIDFLLHDEVRHALRRGFWDALERARR